MCGLMLSARRTILSGFGLESGIRVEGAIGRDLHRREERSFRDLRPKSEMGLTEDIARRRAVLIGLIGNVLGADMSG